MELGIAGFLVFMDCCSKRAKTLILPITKVLRDYYDAITKLLQLSKSLLQ